MRNDEGLTEGPELSEGQSAGEQSIAADARQKICLLPFAFCISESALVAALLAAAFLVRFLPTLYPTFVFDEVFTVLIANYSIPQIHALVVDEFNPPLYYDLIHVMMNIGRSMGGPLQSLAYLRLASVIPGAAACWIGWRAARCCWGCGPALWTLLLLAISPGLIFYSMELRSYGLAQTALLAASVCLFWAAQAPLDPPGPSWDTAFRWPSPYTPTISR
jgi:uncharacterized membrane protein